MMDLALHDWHAIATWTVSLASIALVLIRPKEWPEAVWAVTGAVLLVSFRLIPVGDAGAAVAKGLDVYLFLAGMMIISELARGEGVFDWIAAHAVRAARGSRRRLFFLIYAVGVAVTVFLSNDATAVVLTPAVLASVRAAEADPLPYLLVCAFIANAASFVLPISNPANLVVYGSAMPPLKEWLVTFGVAAAAAIVVTYLVLRLLASKHLDGALKTEVELQPLSQGGRLTLLGIGFLAAALMVSSAEGIDLGAPACVAGLIVLIAVSFRDRGTWKGVAKGVAWSVLPLVAGLFVIVEALNANGALRLSIRVLDEMKQWAPRFASVTAGFGIAAISNLMNNLPSGLITSAAVKSARATGAIRSALLIGVDLGPNLSITGSLATILWLIAIRREGLKISFWDFLKWGIVVMPPALLIAILAAGTL